MGVSNTHRSPHERRKLRIRKKISGSDDRPRLSVFKSSKHTYAQVITDEGQRTVASASTREKEVLDELSKLASAAEGAKNSSKSALAAKAVGIVVARRSKAAEVESVVFDRNGYLYAGRVQALADGAREGGLNF